MFPGHIFLKLNVNAFYIVHWVYYWIARSIHVLLLSQKQCSTCSKLFGVCSHVFSPKIRSPVFYIQNKMTSGVLVCIYTIYLWFFFFLEKEKKWLTGVNAEQGEHTVLQ